MKRIITFWLMGFLMSIAGSKSVTKAGLKTDICDTNAPASTLGPYKVSAFAEDMRPTYLQYTFVESPFKGNVLFSIPLEHHKISEGWMTWSHDYSGDIYWTSENDYSVTLEMPDNTTSFYFYAQPKMAIVNTIRVSAYDGIDCVERISQEVFGNSGACYFGFYGTEGSVIDIIQIDSNAPYAIGEFGISMIPVPEAFVLCNIGLCALMKLRKHRIFEK